MKCEALTLGGVEAVVASAAAEVAALSRVRLVEAFGEVRTVESWAVLAEVRPDTMRKRLARGLPAEVAIALPGHVRHVDPAAACGEPNSWTWELLAFEDDGWAQAFIEEHPRGASFETVGAAWGFDAEHVRQIEASALRKLASRLELGAPAFLAWLRKLEAARADAEEL